MKVSLTTKIFLSFALLLATFALLAFYSVKEFRAVEEDLRSISEGLLVLARLAGQIETHQQNRLRDLRRGIAEPDPKSREVVLRIAAAYFPEVVRSRLEEVRGVCDRQIARLSQRRHADALTKIDFYRAILARVDHIAERHESADELTETLLARVRAGAPTSDLEADIARLETILRTEVYQLNKEINDETDRAVRRAERDEQNATWRVLASTGLAVLLGLLLTVLSARALSPIRDLVAFARAISRGDYEAKVRASGKDELSALAVELQQMAISRKDREAELDRQQAELELAYHRVAELKRYHESVVHSLRTAVVVTDRELAVTSTNRAAETRFGLRFEDVRGRPLESLPIGARLVERVGPLAKLIDGAEPVHVSALPITGGGREAGLARERDPLAEERGEGARMGQHPRAPPWTAGDLLADVSITPFRNENGAVLGLVLAFEDVTEAVRTKEALIRSERLAAIGRMSAHVTHEVRNPLSSIGLNAELLESLVADIAAARGLIEAARAPAVASAPSGPNGTGPDARLRAVEEAQSLCRAIGREVDRLTAITEEYLRFARLPRPELEPRDLGDILGSIIGFLQRDLEAAKVSLELSIPEVRPPIEVDADQIRQAILNLVRNAKESMPSGGKLTLALEIGEREVAIAVRDTGIGIAEENLDRIFDPFYSTKLTGTGLGLALTQQIVAEHGGELRVRSRPGEGSEFRVVMPRARGREITRLPG